ncbi:hypothetical protein MP638_001642 [Amoeboaphelidium occidentale]|nr:hypothetical protein MP638_001642 [Amoeboaphelidium occidentale]
MNRLLYEHGKGIRSIKLSGKDYQPDLVALLDAYKITTKEETELTECLRSVLLASPYEFINEVDDVKELRERILLHLESRDLRSLLDLISNEFHDDIEASTLEELKKTESESPKDSTEMFWMFCVGAVMLESKYSLDFVLLFRSSNLFKQIQLINPRAFVGVDPFALNDLTIGMILKKIYDQFSSNTDYSGLIAALGAPFRGGVQANIFALFKDLLQISSFPLQHQSTTRYLCIRKVIYDCARNLAGSLTLEDGLLAVVPFNSLDGLLAVVPFNSLVSYYKEVVSILRRSNRFRDASEFIKLIIEMLEKNEVPGSQFRNNSIELMSDPQNERLEAYKSLFFVYAKLGMISECISCIRKMDNIEEMKTHLITLLNTVVERGICKEFFNILTMPRTGLHSTFNIPEEALHWLEDSAMKELSSHKGQVTVDNSKLTFYCNLLFAFSIHICDYLAASKWMFYCYLGNRVASKGVKSSFETLKRRTKLLLASVSSLELYTSADNQLNAPYIVIPKDLRHILGIKKRIYDLKELKSLYLKHASVLEAAALAQFDEEDGVNITLFIEALLTASLHGNIKPLTDALVKYNLDDWAISIMELEG